MPKPNQNRKPKAKKAKRTDFDDDASEPYSEELNVSSPEILEMDDGGEVIMNSDWTSRTKAEKKKNKGEKKQIEDSDENEDSESGSDGEKSAEVAESSDDISDEEEWQ